MIKSVENRDELHIIYTSDERPISIIINSIIESLKRKGITLQNVLLDPDLAINFSYEGVTINPFHGFYENLENGYVIMEHPECEEEFYDKLGKKDLKPFRFGNSSPWENKQNVIFLINEIKEKKLVYLTLQDSSIRNSLIHRKSYALPYSSTGNNDISLYVDLGTKMYHYKIYSDKAQEKDFHSIILFNNKFMDKSQFKIDDVITIIEDKDTLNQK